MLEVVRTVDKPINLFMFCFTCTLFFIFFSLPVQSKLRRH